MSALGVMAAICGEALGLAECQSRCLELADVMFPGVG
jgi:hypothetical protein